MRNRDVADRATEEDVGAGGGRGGGGGGEQGRSPEAIHEGEALTRCNDVLCLADDWTHSIGLGIVVDNVVVVVS